MQYIDLLVVNGDFVFNGGNDAEFVSDRVSIAQDVNHRLIESGLLHLLIGENNRIKREQLYNEIIIEVEKDVRLVPGTVDLIPTDRLGNTLYLVADTFDFGAFRFPPSVEV